MATPAKSRERAACVVFGAPRELPQNQLPTYADVMKLYNMTKKTLKEQVAK